MTRVLRSALLLAFLLQAALPQNAPQPAPKPSAPPPKLENLPKEDLPPDEDETEAPKVYSFNPIESDQNIRVGNFYMHKGKYRAAAQRFSEATKWNPTNLDAFFRLGEAEEKLKNKDAAKNAFQRIIQISPDSKQASEAKKKLGGKG